MKKKVIIIGLLVIVMALAIFGCSYSPVDVESFEYKTAEKSVFYSSDGEVIDEAFNQNRTYVKLEDIPKNLAEGIVAVEDARFYKHKGYDPIGILRALLTNLKSGGISEGASTITQQLARNLFKEITTEQTLLRKINEALTARQLEKKYSKDQILEMYLNEIYLGSGTYGVQEASRKYFGKDVSQLSLAECALLAGLPQAPSAYAPDEHFDLAKKRQEIVLDRMTTGAYISKEEAEAAKKEKIVIVGKEAKKSTGKVEYNAYINKVIGEYQKYLQKKYPGREITKENALESVQNDGLKIYTTINSKMQEVALNSLNQGLKSHGLEAKATGSFTTVNSATGAVLAYYGGNTEIDMASKPRQPGSTIKPLVYAKAFEEDLVHPNTLILDAKTTFGNYTPGNVDNQYRGYITVREAIVNSVNIPAVKVMDMIGVKSAVDFIKEFGVTTVNDKDYGLATATGGMTNGISPIEMAKAYGVLANEGVSNELYYIEKILDRDEQVVYERRTDEESTKQVISPDTAMEIKDVLTDVVGRGTATKARTSYVTAGKTGTTNDAKDLWFVGFTGKIASSIWIGNVENKSISGRSSYSAEIYGNYLTGLVDKKLIDDENLQPVSSHNDTISISILSPSALEDIDSLSITKEHIINIVIPKDQETYFQGSRVSVVEIDKETGKLFVQGNCPEENKGVSYYLFGQEPTEQCNESHFLDKIQDFFNGNKNEEENYNESKEDKNNSTDYQNDVINQP